MADVKRKIPFRADRLRKIMKAYPRGLKVVNPEVLECYPGNEKAETLECVLPHRKNGEVFISVQWLADKIGCSLRTLHFALSTEEITPEILDDICRNLNISNLYFKAPDALSINVIDSVNAEEGLSKFATVDKDGFVIYPFTTIDSEESIDHAKQQFLTTREYLRMLSDEGLLDFSYKNDLLLISEEFLDKNAAALQVFIVNSLRKELERIGKKYPNIYEPLEGENKTVPKFLINADTGKLEHWLDLPSSKKEGEDNGGNSTKE